LSETVLRTSEWLSGASLAYDSECRGLLQTFRLRSETKNKQEAIPSKSSQAAQVRQKQMLLTKWLVGKNTLEQQSKLQSIRSTAMKQLENASEICQTDWQMI
jgi:hypothetical protein